METLEEKITGNKLRRSVVPASETLADHFKERFHYYCLIIILNVLHWLMRWFHPRRSTRDSDGEEEEDERRVSRGCTLQYQRALVKVLTQFHTTSSEGTDQVITMLGPDWQVDVTDLVQDSLKVADPRIAELVDRTVLVGLELGSTTLKVKLLLLLLLLP